MEITEQTVEYILQSAQGSSVTADIENLLSGLSIEYLKKAGLVSDKHAVPLQVGGYRGRLSIGATTKVIGLVIKYVQKRSGYLDKSVVFNSSTGFFIKCGMGSYENQELSNTFYRYIRYLGYMLRKSSPSLDTHMARSNASEVLVSSSYSSGYGSSGGELTLGATFNPVLSRETCFAFMLLWHAKELGQAILNVIRLVVKHDRSKRNS